MRHDLLIIILMKYVEVLCPAQALKPILKTY